MSCQRLLITNILQKSNATIDVIIASFYQTISHYAKYLTTMGD